MGRETRKEWGNVKGRAVKGRVKGEVDIEEER